MTADRGIWKLYHVSMPIVNTHVICQLWYMEVIPWLWLLHSLHSGQTVVYIVYTTGSAFDLYSSHSTIVIITCMFTMQNTFDQLKNISKFETTYFDMRGLPAYRKKR